MKKQAYNAPQIEALYTGSCLMSDINSEGTEVTIPTVPKEGDAETAAAKQQIVVEEEEEEEESLDGGYTSAFNPWTTWDE